MSDKFGTGFLRDSSGALVGTTSTAEVGWLGGFLRNSEGALVMVGPEGTALGGVSTGEGAPAKFAKGALYLQVEGSKSIALWEGRGESESPVKRVDLSGTPAAGSVTLESFASSALAAIAKPWRTRQTTATQIGVTAVAGTKYWVLANAVTQSEPGPASTAFSQPWRVGWVAADEVVEGLTTKCKIKAEITVGTAASVTVHVALYKVTKGSKFTLGEEVSGSGVDIALGASANTGVTGETGEFAIPEDGDYALGCTVNGVPANAFDVQARLLVHNV